MRKLVTIAAAIVGVSLLQACDQGPEKRQQVPAEPSPRAHVDTRFLASGFG